MLLIFGGALLYAFKVLRPIFRERGEITAEVTGRLGESLGGIRIVKAYTAEKREELCICTRSPSPVSQHRKERDRRFGDQLILVALLSERSRS